MDKLDQKVLCIESAILFSKGKWNGLKKSNLDELYTLLLNSSTFKRRGDLETDPSYKQIIPQVILKYKDEYFLHRQVNATEKRLNSLAPLALGGHVEEFDLEGEEDLIQTALIREINEEAEIDANIIKKEFLGLIYIEDDNPVNYVHVGLAYIFTIDSNKVKMHEDGLETIGFVTQEYLKEHKDELTYWSKVFVDNLKT